MAKVLIMIVQKKLKRKILQKKIKYYLTNKYKDLECANTESIEKYDTTKYVNKEAERIEAEDEASNNYKEQKFEQSNIVENQRNDIQVDTPDDDTLNSVKEIIKEEVVEPVMEVADDAIMQTTEVDTPKLNQNLKDKDGNEIQNNEDKINTDQNNVVEGDVTDHNIESNEDSK